MYGSASRTFEEARKLVNQAKQARGYFPVVGISSFDDGFNSLPGNRLQAERGSADPAVEAGPAAGAVRPVAPVPLGKEFSVSRLRLVPLNSQQRSFG